MSSLLTNNMQFSSYDHASSMYSMWCLVSSFFPVVAGKAFIVSTMCLHIPYLDSVDLKRWTSACFSTFCSGSSGRADMAQDDLCQPLTTSYTINQWLRPVIRDTITVCPVMLPVEQFQASQPTLLWILASLLQTVRATMCWSSFFFFTDSFHILLHPLCSA